MALFQCHFKSLALHTSTSVAVVLPDAESGESKSDLKKGRKYQALYLLHGLCDDWSKWVRRTPIERYAQKYNLAVIMPDGGKSFYTDMLYGGKYWTYISKELPQIVRTYFPISDRPEDNFVAGASMGGYGSFKLAMKKPGNFCAAASFSGAVDIARLFTSRYQDPNLNFDIDFQKLGYAIFGGTDKIQGTESDLYCLAKELKISGEKAPKLFQFCGIDDGLYSDNLAFKKYLEKLGFDLTFHEGPGGHTWEYWDFCIRQALQEFPLSETTTEER
jgi:S-formylglutathione hydrolase FrmB